jgi:2-keto-4-pentenoate hydratase
VSEPTGTFDPGPAAAVLADAWRSGAILSELPPAVRPRTMAQGYDVQDRFVALLDQPTVGWKLGVGSILQKRQSGVGRSIAGRVLRSHLYRNGDTIPLPNAAPVTVEFEIAYVLGRDVCPDGPQAPALDAVAEMRVTFELVLSRFVDRRAVGWPSFAADNAGFQAIVLGDPIAASRTGELRSGLVVELEGQEAARSLSGDDMTDPEAALADLLAIARERNMVLPQGSIVSTGTVSKPFNTALPRALVRARFLGTELTFRNEVIERDPT